MIETPAPGGSVGETAGLRRRVGRATLWTLVDSWGGQLLQLVTFIVLARALSPRDVGVVALATVFVAFSRLVVGQGLFDVLVHRAELRPSHLNAAFWAGLLISVVLALIAAAFAIPLGHLLDQPDLTLVLQVLSLTVPLAALSAVQMALLRRAMDLRGIALRTLLSIAVGGLVGVGLAAMDAGVWALVGYQLAFSAVSVIVLWQVSPWRPERQLSRLHVRELAGYSANTVTSDLITFAGRNVDNLVVGTILGPATLGVYSIAYRLLDVSHILFGSIARRVVFPALARLQGDIRALTATYLRLNRAAAAAIIPAYVALFLVAPASVEILFGETWVASGAIASALFVGGPAMFMNDFGTACLQALGRADTVRRVKSLWLTFVTIGVLATVSVGVLAVAVAITVSSWLTVPIILRLVAQSTGQSVRAVVAPLSGVAVAAVSMAVVMVLVGELCRPYFVRPAALVLQLGLGAVTLLGSLFILDRQALKDVVTTLLPAAHGAGLVVRGGSRRAS